MCSHSCVAFKFSRPAWVTVREQGWCVKLSSNILQQELKSPPANSSSHIGRPQEDQLLTCMFTDWYTQSRAHTCFPLQRNFSSNLHISICFMTVRVSRKCFRGHCGECTGCQQPNCGTYTECLDKKCFGRPGTKRKAYRNRKCTGLSAAHATAATHTQSVAATISKLSSLAHGSGKNVLQSTCITVLTHLQHKWDVPTCTYNVYILTPVTPCSECFSEGKAFSRDELLKVTYKLLQKGLYNKRSLIRTHWEERASG